MSGTSLPRLLPRARDGYKALRPWKAAMGRGCSFATAQDGLSAKKYGINAPEAVVSAATTGPGQPSLSASSSSSSASAKVTPGTATKGGAPSTPSAARPPPPPPPPPKPSSGGRWLGLSLLGAAAAGGGYVWYTWEEGGPWGLWGPDVFVLQPVPGKSSGAVLVEKREADGAVEPSLVVVEVEAPRKEEFVVVAEEGVAEKGEGEGKVDDSGAMKEVSATEATGAKEEQPAADTEDDEESLGEVEDVFDPMEAARKARLASKQPAPAPLRKEAAPTPVEALLDTGKEEDSSAKVQASFGEAATKADVPSEEASTKSAGLPETTPELIGALEKVFNGLPNLLEEVAHAARVAQHAEDEAKYKIKLEHEREQYQHQLKEARHNVLIKAQMLAKREKELEVQKQKWEATLEAQKNMDEERRLQDLAKQKEIAEADLAEARAAVLAIAECKITDERAARIAELEDIKIKLKALSTAFNARSEDAKKSYTTHKLALGAFALEDAMSQGAALSVAVSELQRSLASEGQEDPLVDVALASLPPNALKSGTGTRTQLHKQLVDLEGAALELALIPAGGKGVLAHALAKLLSKLKVSEKGSGLEGGGADAVLARAEALLADGKLVEAATILEQGFQNTQAAPIVGGWSKAAQERAVAEQALALIQAHAAAQAASLR